LPRVRRPPPPSGLMGLPGTAKKVKNTGCCSLEHAVVNKCIGPSDWDGLLFEGDETGEPLLAGGDHDQ
jgi:hypothetical protein